MVSEENSFETIVNDTQQQKGWTLTAHHEQLETRLWLIINCGICSTYNIGRYMHFIYIFWLWWRTKTWYITTHKYFSSWSDLLSTTLISSLNTLLSDINTTSLLTNSMCDFNRLWPFIPDVNDNIFVPVANIYKISFIYVR